MNSSERLKYLRKDILHLNQEVFANKIGISRSNIGNIELGRVRLIERVAMDICREYNINRAWLLNGTGEIFCTNEISDQSGPSFLSNFYSLSEEGQKEVSKYITAIIAAKKKEEED